VKKDVEIHGPDSLHGFRGEAMNQLPRYRLYIDGLYPGEQSSAIDWSERVISRIHPRVEAKVKIVKQLLPQLWIRQVTQKPESV
jgi:hypothetical protein